MGYLGRRCLCAYLHHNQAEVKPKNKSWDDYYAKLASDPERTDDHEEFPSDFQDEN